MSAAITTELLAGASVASDALRQKAKLLRRVGAHLLASLGLAILLLPQAFAQQPSSVQQITTIDVAAPSAPAPSQGTTINLGSPNMTLTPQNNPPRPPSSAGALTVASGSGVAKWGVMGTLTSLCGGIDFNGRLQEPCGPTPAKFEAAGGGGCAPGEFAGQGSCWTCPRGFNRNILYPADSERACSVRDDSAQPVFFEAQFRGSLCPDGSFRDNNNRCWTCPAGFERVATTGALSDNACAETGVPRAQARRAQALFVQERACAKEEFRDPRNGGECWLCPNESQRTAFPVTSNQACRTPGGVRFAKATRGEVRQCVPGQIHDLADARNPNVAARINAQFRGNVPLELQRSLANNTSGTCWSCPPETKRTPWPIWGDRACRASIIEIQPAQYVHPGIFGLDGGENVALSLIRQRTEIERIAQLMSEITGQSPAQAVRNAWEDIAEAPQASFVLQSAMLARIVAAAVEPQKATADELRLMESFAQAIRSHRVYIAQTALDAYLLWSRTDVAMRGQRNANNMQGLLDYGIPPPDLAVVSAAAIIGGLGSNVAASGAIAALTMTPLVTKVFPFISKGAQKASQESGKKLAQEAGKAMAKQTGKTAAKSGGKSLGALGSVGPQIVVTVAAELLSQAIEQIVDIATAQPKLETKLRMAQAPVNIARMNQTDAGGSELLNQWALLVSGDIPPRNMAEFTAVARAHLAGLAPTAASANASGTNAQFDIISSTGGCLRAMNVNPGAPIGLMPCPAPGNRWLSIAGDLKPDLARCMSDGTQLMAVSCSARPPGQSAPAPMNWDYRRDTGQITNQGRCLEARGTGVTMATCSANPSQNWTLRY